jgi:hypothetical protein
MSTAQELVDAMLLEAHAAHPGIEYSITMAPEHTLLLPKHAGYLERELDGTAAAYRSHVYRDCMVWPMPIPDWMIAITPVTGRIPEAAAAHAYYGDLRTGEVQAVAPAETGEDSRGGT